jgi:hypothetical protein
MTQETTSNPLTNTIVTSPIHCNTPNKPLNDSPCPSSTCLNCDLKNVENRQLQLKLKSLETEIQCLRSLLKKAHINGSPLKPTNSNAETKDKIDTEEKTSFSAVVSNESGPKVTNKKEPAIYSFFANGKSRKDESHQSEQPPQNSDGYQTVAYKKSRPAPTSSITGNKGTREGEYSLTAEERLDLLRKIRKPARCFKKIFITWQREAIKDVKRHFADLDIQFSFPMISFIGDHWLELWIKEEEYEEAHAIFNQLNILLPTHIIQRIFKDRNLVQSRYNYVARGIKQRGMSSYTLSLVYEQLTHGDIPEYD